MNAKEKRKLIEQSNSWGDFGKRLGWRLHGFSGNDSATFFVAGGRTFSITKHEREDIERAIRGEPYPESRDHDLGWCSCVHFSASKAMCPRGWGGVFPDFQVCSRRCGTLTARKREINCPECRAQLDLLSHLGKRKKRAK